MGTKHILKNLHSLIRNSALAYMNEFIWQDIELTDEFKSAYEAYLKSRGYDIEFLGATAVITSSSTKYIYLPNQWFVIASYAVDVFEELSHYKDCFKKVADDLYERPDDYAKRLRDYPTARDRAVFLSSAKKILSSYDSDPDVVEESALRLWRFVTDYAWWSGQKTIDRGDFYLSVILNMLNLVNASQTYVGEIVNAYASDTILRELVKSVDGFTVNMETVEAKEKLYYPLPDDEVKSEFLMGETAAAEATIPKPDHVKIKIGGTSNFKEIKFKK